MQATIKDGVRYSTAKSFLTPILGRPNLHILINAHVTQVLFKTSSGYG